MQCRLRHCDWVGTLSFQTPLGARPVLRIQPFYEAPGDLWVKNRKGLWLTSGECGSPIDNGLRMATGQPNSRWGNYLLEEYVMRCVLKNLLLVNRHLFLRMEFREACKLQILNSFHLRPTWSTWPIHQFLTLQFTTKRRLSLPVAFIAGPLVLTEENAYPYNILQIRCCSPIVSGPRL